MADSILIIENEASLRRDLASAFSSAGFVTTTVSDYAEGSLQLDELNPDMVIVDEVLLDGDGMEICHQLHSNRSIPVILLGEDSNSDKWERVMKSGATDFYVVRPFSYQILVAIANIILRRCKARWQHTDR